MYLRSSRPCFQRDGLERAPLGARSRAPAARVTSRHEARSPLRGSLYRPGEQRGRDNGDDDDGNGNDDGNVVAVAAAAAARGRERGSSRQH